jgi:hypothetical protein
MKENALLASAPGGAARLIVEHVAALKKRMPGLKIHLVGHSAGAILLAPLVQLLTSSGEIASGPMQGATGAGLTVTTCTLWAPACTTGLFRETYLPAILSSDIESFTQYSLNDQAERDDTCANIYHKSLLYLVSHALEDEERIPGHSPGTPIMGMADAIGEDSAIQDMFARNNAHLVLAPNNAPDDSISASKARAHGAFDDDLPTVMSTFKRILAGAGAPSQVARGARASRGAGVAASTPSMPAHAAAQRDGGTPMFRRSESSLRDQRAQIDLKTMR